MLLNINATRAFILVFYDIKSKRISHRHSCNVYMRSLCGSCPADEMSPPPHDLERLRTTKVDVIVIFNRGRSVVDFVRVAYFVPLNGPLNGHPPSMGLRVNNEQYNINVTKYVIISLFTRM